MNEVVVEEEIDVKKIINPKDLLKNLERLNQSFYVTWTDKHGTTRDLKNLSDSHLNALIPFLKENNLLKTMKIVICERVRRKTGMYPSNFEDLCKKYNRETWRLKVINIKNN